MSTFLLFGRTLLALAVVLLLVFGLARLARRGQNNSLRRQIGRSSGASIEVLSKKSLSRTAAIALISVGERTLVVGATPQSVTLISEIPSTELQLDHKTGKTETDPPWMAESRQSPTAWDAFISKLREISVRP